MCSQLNLLHVAKTENQKSTIRLQLSLALVFLYHILSDTRVPFSLSLISTC